MTATGPHVTVLIPCHADWQVTGVVASSLAHADDVLVVGDDPTQATRVLLDRLAGPRVAILHRTGPPAKGDTLAFGVAALLKRPSPPDLVAVVDADGQHPPSCLPRFVEAAAHADVVVGNRRGARQAMAIRVGNDLSSLLLGLRLGRRLPDTQCGMRLFRTSALRRVPFPPGGFEAETHHLSACVRAGLRVAWVDVPAVYEGERSDFRPLRDSARVLRAVTATARS